MELANVIGLKVVAIKSFRTDLRKQRNLKPRYIVFSDGKTYIELEEQDYYSFHDCSTCAREITIYQDEKHWNHIMENNKNYPDANIDL
jgi:hypothetical protein